MELAQKKKLIEFVKDVYPLAILVGFVLFSLYVNNVIIKFRFDEFELKLASLSNEELESKSINLLSRFHKVKDKKGEKKDSQEEIEQEIRLQTMGQDLMPLQKLFNYNMSEKAVLGMVKGVRVVLGKEHDMGARGFLDDPDAFKKAGLEYNKDLEIALYYERKRNYAKAIEIYDKILKQDIGPTLRSNVLVHRGFCEGLLGKFNPAKQTLNTIIDDPDNLGTSNWQVSKKLVNAINELQSQTQSVLNQNVGDLEKGKQLFLVGNAYQAIEFLNKFLESGTPSLEEKLEAYYYLGRANEAVGQSQLAIQYYQKVISMGATSIWAKESNRRLYVLGKFYENNESLTKIAEKNSAIYGDTSFVNKLQKFEKIQKMAPQAKPEGLPEEEVEQNDSAQAELMASLEIKSDTQIIVTEKLEEKESPILDLLADISAQDSTEGIGDDEVLIDENSILARGDSLSGDLILGPQDPLRKKDIYSIIRVRSIELNHVFTKWKNRGVILGGELTIQIQIAPSGKVIKTKILKKKGKLNFIKFENDVLSKIQKWKFRPVPDHFPNVLIEFPIIFRAQGDNLAIN